MPLSWNEIKSRAALFVKEWENAASEDAEAKSFWDDFFNVFGVKRRRLATFEEQVKKLGQKAGFIDLLWKGVLLVEHKSKGVSLDKAFAQAKDYFPGLKEKELPRYIIVCNFEKFRLYDLDENTQTEFFLSELLANIYLFGFIAGYQKRTFKEQDPVNIEAAELMGLLHDKLKQIGYEGHQLELYLVRLLFILFADDTNIFDRDTFHEYIELKTSEDGSDLAPHIAQIFEILNTPKEKRLKNIDELLAAVPYVNGKLFEEHLPLASFDSEMRQILLDCCALDWGKISPAIFGSLFQSVMDSKARRNLGAHYTSEKNIMKLIKPLFLDELWMEFESVKDSKIKLQRFHDKLSTLRFLDPACGCGNFLIIAYREIRLLEIEVIKTLLFKHEKLRPEVAAEAGVDVGLLIKCDVDRFYGIEYEEFPAQIAQVAMWLIDHQMNQLVSDTFGEYYVRLPLRKSATIKHGNALRIDWQSLIEPMPWEKEATRYHYILGNPPFIGKQFQSTSQKQDIEYIFAGFNGTGLLDYVATWYYKAADYLALFNNQVDVKLPKTRIAFVSTNSITQGEQAGILWSILYNHYKIKIHFAHRTFNWTNEAKGKAAVHCVIIGFSNFDISEKLIFEYDSIKAEPHEIQVKNINPYLVEGKDIFITKKRKPICNVKEMVFGSMPNDGGYFLFDEHEKNEFLEKDPSSKKYFRRFIGSHEFLNNISRWCLWLADIEPKDLKSHPEILKIVENVRRVRFESTRPTTRKLAEFPTLFGEIRQPKSDYLVFPEVSSIRRKYIPVGFVSKEVITSNKNYTIENASPYDFGVLCSIMHISWATNVGGKLKSDFQYSTGMVYNNFPWPESPTEKQKEAVEKAAQAVLDARAQYPNSSLADLYDPNTMPPALVKAHSVLDKAVDLCYRSQPFGSEAKRIEFLFELYEKYTGGLFGPEKKGKKK